MLLIQLAVTAAIVAFVTDQKVKALIANPINALRILSGNISEEFMWALRIRFVAFWSAIIFGLAGVWAL